MSAPAVALSAAGRVPAPAVGARVGVPCERGYVDPAGRGARAPVTMWATVVEHRPAHGGTGAPVRIFGRIAGDWSAAVRELRVWQEVPA